MKEGFGCGFYIRRPISQRGGDVMELKNVKQQTRETTAAL